MAHLAHAAGRSGAAVAALHNGQLPHATRRRAAHKVLRVPQRAVAHHDEECGALARRAATLKDEGDRLVLWRHGAPYGHWARAERTAA